MILPVLLAGGSGTRLWPLSRELYPKQFLKLLDDKSLLQSTALRARRVSPQAAPIVICNEQHRFLVAEQLREVGIANAVIILEPEGRNTAPAAAVAAHHVAATQGADALVFLMSADQAVENVEAFAAAAQHAAEAAGKGRLTTFGIKPTRPETGFGYIKTGPPLESGGGKSGKAFGNGALEVERFVEKPDAKTAEKFLKDGGYWWNGGLFLFPAGLFLDELKRLEPGMFDATAAALREAKRDLDFIRLDAAAFKQARNDSIDYAVMEKTTKVACVPLDAGWDDVGSWGYMDKLPAKDARGNVARGDVWLEDSDNSFVHAEGRMVALVGVKDHVVVETPDAVLVAARSRVQDVKKIAQRLKEQKRSEASTHPRVYRPWGWYETVAISDRFQVKRIQVKPGQKLSLQMHHHRAEHWVVVKGTAQVTCGEKVFLLTEDQSTYIPLGNKHRLENPGNIPLEIIEVQSGAYLGEDDIVRFEDVYGRTK